MEELSSKVAEFKSQLSMINEVLEADPDNAEYLKIKTELEELLSIINPTNQNGEESNGVIREGFKEEKVLEEAPVLGSLPKGTRVESKYSLDNVWYPAVISGLNNDGTKYIVVYEGYGNTEEVEFLNVKPIINKAISKDAELIKVGSKVMAQYSLDNVFYNAVVESIENGTYMVIFEEYGNKEARQLNHLKLIKTTKVDNKSNKNSKNKEEEDILNAEFVIPENLRLKPTDNEVDKKRKRKKVKILKQNFNAKVKTAEDTHVRSEWENFKMKVEKKKPMGAVSNLKKESIFKSTDLLSGSGSGSTQFTEFQPRKKAKVDQIKLNVFDEED